MATIATFTFAEAASLIRRAFPEARSRRPVRVEARATYSVRDYWDGGSREEARFVDLATGRALSSESVPRSARQQAGNPFGLAIYDVTLTPGFAVIEHTIFRGKDYGYRIHVASELALTDAAPVRALLGRAA